MECVWKEQKNLSGQAPSEKSLKRKVINQCILPAMTHRYQTWSLTKAYVKKIKTGQRAMERKMLNHNAKLKDRICNTISRQRTRVAEIVQYATKMEWAGHITRMKDDRWTIRSTEWQIKSVRSAERPKRRWRDDTVGQQGAVWTRIAKNRESWRTLAEGYFLQWKDTAYNRTEQHRFYTQKSHQKWWAPETKLGTQRKKKSRFFITLSNDSVLDFTLICVIV